MDKSLNTEEQVQFLGESLAETIQRLNEFIGLMKQQSDTLDQHLAEHHVADYNERVISNLRNEVTYLHNELNEVKKNLGMDGSVATRGRGGRKYEYK